MNSSDDLMISPMVSLELTYLHEIWKITASAEIILDDLRHRVGLSTSRTAFEAVIAQAQTLSFTRDPFDRIIAANALTDACPLLTADERMRNHVPGAVWD